MAKEPRPGFLEQIEKAKVSVAMTALVHPFIYSEGQELVDARRALVNAQYRVIRAQKAWDQLIAPAEGKLPDPLKAE